MAKIDRFFIMLKEQGASDLHVLVGAPPKFRLRGELEPIPGEPFLTRNPSEIAFRDS